jgi:hypothetical protein
VAAAAVGEAGDWVFSSREVLANMTSSRETDFDKSSALSILGVVIGVVKAEADVELIDPASLPSPRCDIPSGH